MGNFSTSNSGPSLIIHHSTFIIHHSFAAFRCRKLPAYLSLNFSLRSEAVGRALGNLLSTRRPWLPSVEIKAHSLIEVVRHSLSLLFLTPIDQTLPSPTERP